MRQFIAVLFLLVVGEFVRADEPISPREATIRQLPALHLREPVWTGDIVHRESTTPLQRVSDTSPTGRVAFPVAELLQVESADGLRKLEIGREVTLAADKRTLIFSVPELKHLKESEFFPTPDAPQSYKHRVNHPEQNMFYAPGRWFHDRNWEVTYRRSANAWTSEKPPVAEQQLARTLKKLRAGLPLTLGVSGDSIAAGGDASGLNDVAPRMPAFPELVAASLQADFQSPVTLKNRAVGGWSVANGVQDLDKLLEEKPDLILIAYGMNDVGRRDPAWFKGQTQQLLARIAAANPPADVILVTPMLGNPEWLHTPPEMFAKYRDTLTDLTGPGVVLADVTAVWTVLMEHKHHHDMTGNGLNHPNDFGHRIYAQTVLSTLLPPR